MILDTRQKRTKRIIGMLSLLTGIALLLYLITYLRLIFVPEKSPSTLSGLDVIVYMPIATLTGIASVSLCAFGIYTLFKTYAKTNSNQVATLANAQKQSNTKSNELIANTGFVVLLFGILILDTWFLVTQIADIGFGVLFLHLFFAYIPEILFVGAIILIVNRLGAIRKIRSNRPS